MSSIKFCKASEIIELVVLRVKEVFSCIALMSTYVIAKFFRDRSDLWLISERGYEAKDNGYVFYCYLKRCHPEVKVRYVISKKSLDIKKFTEWEEDCVDFGSIKHYIAFWKASHLISTHPMGCSPIRQDYFLLKLHTKFGLLKNKKHIFLQHGIIKDDLPVLYSENMKIDIFICGAKPEFEYVKSHFHYCNNEVRYTGLCRFDNLNSFAPKKQILIMPTWRSYIDRKGFENSNYFHQYKKLLQSTAFHNILKFHKLTAVFYPHYAFQQCIESFRRLELPSSVIIGDLSFDVQELLKESEVLISDYSSVYFDMAYMHKPSLLFQFDEAEYREYHYKEGYFNVESICEKYVDLESLLAGLERVIESGFVMKRYHEENADAMFLYRDSNNCERVFNEITRLQ